VDEEKDNKSVGGKEVNGAGGLLTAKAGYECGKNRRDRGRHSESGPDHNGEQHEDH
jgi:hypothetical protein